MQYVTNLVILPSFYLGRMFLYSLILCNIFIFYTVGPTDHLHPSLAPRLKTFRLFLSDLLSEVSMFRQRTQLSSKCSISLFSSLNLSPLTYVSDNVPLCNCRINFCGFLWKSWRVFRFERSVLALFPLGSITECPIGPYPRQNGECAILIVFCQKACKLLSTGPYYGLLTLPLAGCDFRVL
jgi:hypothetical protein